MKMEIYKSMHMSNIYLIMSSGLPGFPGASGPPGEPGSPGFTFHFTSVPFLIKPNSVNMCSENKLNECMFLRFCFG